MPSRTSRVSKLIDEGRTPWSAIAQVFCGHSLCDGCILKTVERKKCSCAMHHFIEMVGIHGWMLRGDESAAELLESLKQAGY